MKLTRRQMDDIETRRKRPANRRDPSIMTPYSKLSEVAEAVADCRGCPRLVKFRESVPSRKSFRSEQYWRRPVAGFGDPRARLVVLGLAPAAHGGNRTGRVFTGDESGRFLVRALYEAGYANQPTSEARGDGLIYTDCYVTAAVKCAPPHDKPTAEEFDNCSAWLDSELRLLTNAKAVIALGRAAFDAYLDYATRQGATVRRMTFTHGGRYALGRLPVLYASYHPSPRNTHTGKLTMGMLVAVLERVKHDNAPYSTSVQGVEERRVSYHRP
jgi:uracil-DNA glycosylase